MIPLGAIAIMNLPEGFPPLDDLLPTNPLTYTPPDDVSKLFTDPDSPIWDYNIIHHPLSHQLLYVQGYYGCLVDIWLMTGMAVSLQINTKAIDVAVECCQRYGRIYKTKPAGGLTWLYIGASGQTKWPE